MANMPPFIITNDGTLVVIAANGATKSLDKNAANYQAARAAIDEKRWDDLLELFETPKRQIESFKDKEGEKVFEVVDGVVTVRGRAVPDMLSSHIIEFADNKLPHEPLLKFWDNLEQNPSYRAVQELYGFLQANKHPITEDGCFIAYKGVNEDWTDCHSGKINNSLGTHVEVPRNMVDENPNVTCSYGLHVGNFAAASNYWHNAGHMLVVKVNPKDVVAVPKDYHETKMRVCAYDVLQETAKPMNDSPLYEHHEPTDDDFKAAVEEMDEENEGPCCPHCDSVDCAGECEDNELDEDECPYCGEPESECQCSGYEDED